MLTKNERESLKEIHAVYTEMLGDQGIYLENIIISVGIDTTGKIMLPEDIKSLFKSRYNDSIRPRESSSDTIY